MNYDIDTLKEKLQSGDITIDQFTDAFTKFNVSITMHFCVRCLYEYVIAILCLMKIVTN